MSKVLSGVDPNTGKALTDDQKLNAAISVFTAPFKKSWKFNKNEFKIKRITLTWKNIFIKHFRFGNFFWTWIFRLFFLTIALFSMIHISDNLSGMLILFLISLCIAIYQNYDTIFLFEDRIELQRRYIFNFFVKKRTYIYHEVKSVESGSDLGKDRSIDFISFYSLKNVLYIRMNDNSIQEIHTFILLDDLLYLIKIVKNKLKK